MSDYQSPPMSPSDMIDDRPVSMDRVITIEATMDEMKSQHEATHQMLQDVLTRLGPVDESLTSLAVYFRNWHMFSEYMNNISC